MKIYSHYYLVSCLVSAASGFFLCVYPFKASGIFSDTCEDLVSQAPWSAVAVQFVDVCKSLFDHSITFSYRGKYTDFCVFTFKGGGVVGRWVVWVDMRCVCAFCGFY